MDLDALSKKWPKNKFSLTKLSAGETHFEDTKESGFPVVLVHGVSGPMTAWDKTIPFLSSIGVRSIRYDLYGRGFSERLSRKHDLSLYVDQLADLLQHLKVEQKIIIIASSFGSVIAAEFANRFPRKVQGLILIGPAGTPIEVPFIARLRDVPLLGNLLFHLAGKSTIIDQNEKYFIDKAAWEEHRYYFEDQLSLENSDQAILSTMRNSPVQSYIDGFKQLGESHLPVGVIWGKLDATFPYANHEYLQSAIPDMQLFTLENTAHLPQYERPDQTNQIIDNLIQSYLSKKISP